MGNDRPLQHNTAYCQETTYPTTIIMLTKTSNFWQPNATFGNQNGPKQWVSAYEIGIDHKLL